MKLLESGTVGGDSPVIENILSLLSLFLSTSGHEWPGGIWRN